MFKAPLRSFVLRVEVSTRSFYQNVSRCMMEKKQDHGFVVSLWKWDIFSRKIHFPSFPPWLLFLTDCCNGRVDVQQQLRCSKQQTDLTSSVTTILSPMKMTAAPEWCWGPEVLLGQGGEPPALVFLSELLFRKSCCRCFWGLCIIWRSIFVLILFPTAVTHKHQPSNWICVTKPVFVCGALLPAENDPLSAPERVF